MNTQLKKIKMKLNLHPSRKKIWRKPKIKKKKKFVEKNQTLRKMRKMRKKERLKDNQRKILLFRRKKGKTKTNKNFLYDIS